MAKKLVHGLKAFFAGWTTSYHYPVSAPRCSRRLVYEGIESVAIDFPLDRV
jgi:hypothetical protein